MELPIERFQSCWQQVRQAMVDLRAFLQSHPLQSPEQEIVFFKHIKPRYHALLIYYHYLYELEKKRPIHSTAIQKRYLEDALEQVNRLFNEILPMVEYIRSGASNLDQQYFTRSQRQSSFPTDPATINLDQEFVTAHDYTLARMLAYEQLGMYLEMEKERYNPSTYVPLHKKSQLSWLLPVAGAVELIYGLIASHAFGNLPPKQVADAIAEFFNIKIDNVHKRMEEIRHRKKSKTALLDNMREALLARIADDIARDKK